MKRKVWYIASIIVIIFYFIMGITYLGKNNIIGIWSLFVGILSLIGIILFTLDNYNIAKTIFIISGTIGSPIGILLIILGILMEYLPDND